MNRMIAWYKWKCQYGDHSGVQEQYSVFSIPVLQSWSICVLCICISVHPICPCPLLSVDCVLHSIASYCIRTEQGRAEHLRYLRLKRWLIFSESYWCIGVLVSSDTQTHKATVYKYRSSGLQFYKPTGLKTMSTSR